MIKTRDILIFKLKSSRYTVQQMANELDTSPQAIRYHLGLIEGLQAERIRVRFPNNARHVVTEYWLA
jgi:predicted ArsR family transcriptional regulator